MLNQQPANRSLSDNRSRPSVEVEVRQYRNLVDEWNKVVSQIRTFDGFSKFLLPPSFSDLQKASSEGPVIILIASQYSCDAIIVLHKESPIHIPLKTTLDTLTALVHQFQKEVFNLKEEYPTFNRNHQQEQSLCSNAIPDPVKVVAETLEQLHLQSDREISNNMMKVL
ncbi:hypothetical protein BDN67DRAFT_630089 [Paxillus ammoniavirescens]|nr:hypothetical protein BDN67DRAFT_630089 [Paxillus ammoniavirescens]